VAANTVVYARVLVAAAILSPALALALAPAMIAPGVIGLAAAWSGARQPAHPDEPIAPASRNPLQLRSALEMAVVFQVVLILVALIGSRFGASGLLGTAVVVGLNDVDALTLSMAREVGQGDVPVTLGARAVTVGLLSNAVVKLALAAGAGEGTFRRSTGAVLILMGAALAAAVVLLPRG
jgi:uncharacterized membrane protein (DUF4010 family)